MDKLFFILSNLTLLFLFLLSSYGFGFQGVKRSKFFYVDNNIDTVTSFIQKDKVFISCLSISLGIGIEIVILQLLGIFGYINSVMTVIINALGLVLFVREWPYVHHGDGRVAKTEDSHSKAPPLFVQMVLFGILISYVLIVIVHSLTPPIKFDEIMYHLPHAREWASSGYITINKWLRYPYFPYNFNLLYAACLTLNNDVLPHLIHSTVGLLTLVGVYRVSLVEYNRAVASLAVIVLGVSLHALGLFYNAYIDLSLTFFLFFGFYCAYLGYEHKNINCFFLSAFLIGLAVGVKYQAMIYIVPFVLIVVMRREYKITHVLKIAFYFLLPCAYWYVRNYLLTGNPVEPLAGSLFGYYSWNQSDMRAQLGDLQHHAGWPILLLWPAILSLLTIKNASKFSRFMIALSLYSFMVWYFTSHYPRYLVMNYSFIAILSAFSLYNLFLNLIKIKERYKWGMPVYHGVIVIATCCVLLSVSSFPRYLNEMPVTDNVRHEFLKNRINSYEIGLFLKSHPEYKTVQRHFEGEMFYLPKDTIGDWFGEGRYNDYANLSSKLLAKKIKAFNANTFLVTENDSRDLNAQKDFNKYFFLIMSTKNARLYGLKELKTT